MKKIVLHFVVFISTILFLWCILIITSCIPNSDIKENIYASAIYFSNRDAFEFGDNNSYNSISDNYADSILLNVLWNIKSNSPFTSSIDTKYYDGEEYGENWGLYQAISGTSPNTDYTRYWHGSVAFIRPLLLFTDINGIKNISFIILLLLICITEFLLISKKHYFAAVALFISLIGIQFWNIRLSLEYIPAFMVCFALCPLYIFLEEKGDIFLTVLSVISGVTIAFFDFLTVETITVLVPLVLVFCIRADEKRSGSFKNNLILIVNCGLCWGISYIMTFIVKWIAATFVTGDNKFISALSAASIRFSGENTEVKMPVYKQIPAAIAANLSTIFGGTERIETDKIVFGILVITLIFAVIICFFGRKEKNISFTFTMLIISVIPYFRYMLLNNHSYLHEFFTYRAQITTILCLCAILWYNIEFKSLKKRR